MVVAQRGGPAGASRPASSASDGARAHDGAGRFQQRAGGQRSLGLRPRPSLGGQEGAGAAPFCISLPLPQRTRYHCHQHGGRLLVGPHVQPSRPPGRGSTEATQPRLQRRPRSQNALSSKVRTAPRGGGATACPPAVNLTWQAAPAPPPQVHLGSWGDLWQRRHSRAMTTTPWGARRLLLARPCACSGQLQATGLGTPRGFPSQPLALFFSTLPGREPPGKSVRLGTAAWRLLNASDVVRGGSPEPTRRAR